jgi:hypothetical protein
MTIATSELAVVWSPEAAAKAPEPAECCERQAARALSLVPRATVTAAAYNSCSKISGPASWVFWISPRRVTEVVGQNAGWLWAKTICCQRHQTLPHIGSFLTGGVTAVCAVAEEENVMI